MKIYIVQIGLLFATTVGLSACAPDMMQGQAENWYQLGYQDAYHGHAKRNSQKLLKAQKQIGLPLNKRNYQLGWASGIKHYCSESNGYNLGAKGIVYNSVCPDNLIYHFDQAWQEGLITYCTKDNGYKRGRAGKSYSGFCPPNQNIIFEKAYKSGYRAFLRSKKS